ncbi:cyclase [Armatimonadota bacterium]|nr:cyclase [Armatimonadota bacterium]
MKTPFLNRREALQYISGLAVGATALYGASASASAVIRFGEEHEGEQRGIKVEKLTDDISLLIGVGGNIAVLVGKEGVLQIDAGNPGTSPQQVAGLKELTDKPVTTLINTHWHGDHTGGNADMAKAGSRIFAHDNTRKRLSSEQFIEAFNSKVPASPEIALPILTFNRRMTLYHGGEELHMTNVPPAHTDTDIFIHFVKANVLHAGDLFFNGMYPFIDSSTKGWIGGMVGAADKILAVVNDKTKIIPGHGPLATKEQFKQYRDMLVTVHERITPLVKSGKSVEDTVAAKPLADLDDKWGKGFMKPDVFVKIVYGGIKKFGM